MASYVNLDSSDDFIPDTPPVTQSNRRLWRATTPPHGDASGKVSKVLLLFTFEVKKNKHRPNLACLFYQDFV